MKIKFKYYYFFVATFLVSTSSCMYLKDFGKRPLFLVGANDDIQVTHNGKKVDVIGETIGIVGTDHSGHHTYYWHPAVLIKVRRNNNLVFKSEGKMATLNVKGRYGKGILYLALETPITLGIGTLVDLATRSFYHTKSKYIDINAVFNKTTHKSEVELKYTAKENAIIR